MRLTLSLDGDDYAVDLSSPIDLAIAVDFDGPQPHAFGLPRAVAVAFDAEGFVGDTRRGGSCNCETVTINPHGSGTHTECAGHVTRERITIAGAVREQFVPCTLISVVPHRATRGDVSEASFQSDLVVSRGAIEQALVGLGEPGVQFLRALAVRTLPNDESKRSAEYTGTNPPYMTVAAMRMLRELGVEHLVVDLPSVDRENDDGALAAHRVFFGVDDDRRLTDATSDSRTITEMAFIPDDAADGAYVLNLQTPAFLLDAAPSRPVLFRVQRAS